MFHTSQLHQREIRHSDFKFVKQAFDFADVEKNGYLSMDDFKVAHIAIFGCKPSKHEMQDIIRKYGKIIDTPSIRGIVNEHTHVIDFEQYQQVMIDRLKYTDIDDEIRETFHILDARCKGFIDFEDFKNLVHRFLPRFDLLRVRKLFDETDRDSDGRVSYRDFQILMNNDLFKA